MAGHRARVAEAEIDVFVAIDAAEAGARRFVDEKGKGRGPLDHPVHRDAVEEGVAGLLVQLRRARMGGPESRVFSLAQGCEAVAVNRSGGGGRHRPMMHRPVYPRVRDPEPRDATLPRPRAYLAKYPWGDCKAKFATGLGITLAPVGGWVAAKG